MNTVLHNDTIQLLAPSVFAYQPWEQMGERYGFIPTIEIIDLLRRNDFAVTAAMQSRTRIDGRRPFTKHMLRMRHLSYIDKPASEIPEIVIVNSHDGRCSYQFHAGIFRMVCGNGLIVKSKDFASIRMRHQGGDALLANVMEVTRAILDHAPLVMDRIERWKGMQLTHLQEYNFACMASTLRPVFSNDPDALLIPRRGGDSSNDLWTVANRIQENLLRGGVSVEVENHRYIRPKKISSVNSNLQINARLWEMAEKLEACMS